MKKDKLFFVLHPIILGLFSIWYIFMDGYLGYGLGDLRIVFPIFFVTVLSIILLFLKNRIGAHFRLFFNILLLGIDILVIILFIKNI